MLQENKIFDLIKSKWLLILMIILFAILVLYAFVDIVLGNLVMKDLSAVYKDIGASFFFLLLLKNSALIFLLLFFISEYKVNQRQYLQYKFKKNVAYSLTSVEDRYKKDNIDVGISKISLEIYKDIVYSEPAFGKKDIKKELPENK